MTTSGVTKRLTVDMTSEEHRRLKTLAAFHGVTMKDYLLTKALFDKKAHGKTKSAKRAETDYLLSNPANKKRLLNAVRRNRTGNRQFASLKDLKNALGI
ncbi:MAG: hypothetical protein Q8P86_04135 [bacterium]|nr:hypothetical protein [bacterium]